MDTDQDPYKITAVVEDVPANSQLQFDVLASFDTFVRYNGKDAEESWTWSDFWHFIELTPEADPKVLESKFSAFSDRYFRGTEVSGSQEIFTLQPLNDAHLYSAGLEYEIGQTSQGKAVWSLLIIAFFILIIAWINYINLSSVRAIERSKEVGIRKVVGARRISLITQFLTESLLVNVLALLLAWQVVILIKPWFASNFDLDPSSMRFVTQGNYLLPLVMLGLVLTGVLVSGIYPAWLLSVTHVSNVLKGVFQKDIGGAGLRRGLVIFQFAASIALIAGTWIVSKQIQFINQQDLRIDFERVVTVDGPRLTPWDSTFINRMNTFKDKLLTNPRIQSAANSNRTIDDGWQGRVFQIEKTSDHPSGEKFTSSHISTSYGFDETYGLTLLAGRFFRESDHGNDWDKPDKIVINEKAVKIFGYGTSKEALGQTLKFRDKNHTIIGVMANFHEMSLHNEIEPLIFLPFYGTSNKLSLLVDADNMDATMSFIEDSFNEFFPDNVFHYTFLNQSYQRLYEADRRFGRILSFFTLLTILIACLGLFGLVSYMTVLRTKEIGIRKVLGASISGLVLILSKDFLKLVLISLIIASPVAYYFMNQWLQEFAYHIDIQWWMFVVAGFLAIGVAFFTVSFQSIKAALANPIQSIRTE